MSTRPLRSARLVAWPTLGAAALALFAACGDSRPDTIDRAVFIDAYVALRIAAVETDSGTVAASDRQAILDRLGVSEDDLVTFAEVHGTDLEFMRDVWNDVEVRLDSIPDEP